MNAHVFVPYKVPKVKEELSVKGAECYTNPSAVDRGVNNFQTATVFQKDTNIVNSGK